MIYYRGSSSYADAVTNQLNTLEETGLVTSQAISNLELGITSEIQDLRSDFQTAAVGLYNQGQEIRNDIQASTAMNINAIQGMAMGITSDIRESTYAVVASQQMLANTFNQGFSSVNNTINLGFCLVGNKIDVLSEEVSSKLDEIQDILNNPRLTQSRELYREALRSYKRGFYEEALEDCLGAIEKNKTDYISWYLLGLIYLYGAGENSNVINLDKAEEAFTNAAKYIKPDIAKSDEAKLFASDIYYNLGFSRLAKSNDYLIENKVDDSNTKLLEAEEASRTSYQLSKENLLARYEHAKSLHFLGKDDEVLKILEELIRKEKNFAIKSVNDENFKSLWSSIEKLIEKLKLEVCNQIKNKIKETIDFYENKLKANDEIANYELPRNYRTSNIEVFQKKQNELKLRYADIENKDYFTVLNLKKQLSGDLDNFSNEISNLIHDTKTAIEQKLAEERRIQQEEREREQAELRRQREERERQEREERRRKEKEEERILEEQRRQRRQEEEEKKQKEEKLLKKRIRRIKASIIISSFLLGILIGIIGIVVFQNMNIEVMSTEEVLPLSGWICLAVGFLYFVLRIFYKGLGDFGGCFLGSLPIAFISFIGSLFFMACVGEGEDLLLLISIVVSIVFFLLFGLLIAKDVDCENLNKMKIVLTILFILLVCFFCICILYYINTEQYKTNMLIKGVKQNNIKKIEQYINSGADKDKAFRTAIENGNEEIIELFIKNDISISIAIKFADKELLDLFIKNGYNINDYSILNTAILYGEVEMIEYLINLGADINTENPPIITLLRNPDRFNDLNEATYVFDLLIKSGADVNIQSGDWMKTPLIVLANEITFSSRDPILDEWYVNIAKKLLKSGAKVNIVDSSGYAVLNYLNLDENYYASFQLSKEEENLNKQYDQKLRDLLISYGAKMARKN